MIVCSDLAGDQLAITIKACLVDSPHDRERLVCQTLLLNSYPQCFEMVGLGVLDGGLAIFVAGQVSDARTIDVRRRLRLYHNQVWILAANLFCHEIS